MTVTGLITAMVIGAILGFVGRLVVPGRHAIPIWLTILVGIVAAFIGTFIARLLGVADTSGFDFIELIIQVVVSAVGVTIIAGIHGRRSIRRAESARPTWTPQPPAPSRPASQPNPEVLIRRAHFPSTQTVTPSAPPRTTPPSGIFLSYRRSDSRYAARGVAERLRERFGRSEVFMDVDSLRPGIDFQEGVRDAIRTSAVVLVLIGDSWADAQDDQHRKRLDDPEDNVRTEVEHALQLRRRVLPVLLDEAVMPHRDKLPPSLASLPRLNAVRVHHTSWDSDVAALILAVDGLRRSSPA